MKKAGLVSGEGKPKHAIDFHPPFVVNLQTANSKLVRPVFVRNRHVCPLVISHMETGPS